MAPPILFYVKPDKKAGNTHDVDIDDYFKTDFSHLPEQ